MTSEEQEQHRADCEARYWLKSTGGKSDDVNALIRRVAMRRGKLSAERLRNDMRRIYREGRSDAAAQE